jgi:phage portal protein BeeE
MTFEDLDSWLQYGLANPIINQTLVGEKETIGNDFAGYVAGAYMRSGPVFACIAARMLLFSEARFQYRRRQNGRPGELFGDQNLAVLETPWPGGTTGDLLSRMELDVSLAGNSFTARQQGAKRVTRLRPDWTTMVIGTPNETDSFLWDPDAELLGYVYTPGGAGSGQEKVIYRADEVAHYAPIPDPMSPFRGMSWLTPVISEILGDRASGSFKQSFFENGATPNMVVKVDITDEKEFEAWVKRFRFQHEGRRNAYRTLFLQPGIDATVVGSNMKEISFREAQAVGETRIAAAAGVPPAVLGISDGLQGSALNAGNFEAALSRFANLTMRPLWRNAAGSLARIVQAPDGAELWYDDRDIPALQAAEKDRADAVKTKAESISTLVSAGYDPDSVVSAVAADDISLLQHTGLVSVQLLPPGSTTTNGKGATALASHRKAD